MHGFGQRGRPRDGLLDQGKILFSYRYQIQKYFKQYNRIKVLVSRFWTKKVYSKTFLCKKFASRIYFMLILPDMTSQEEF